jgi:transglutaminase-like putative cysteine protease
MLPSPRTAAALAVLLGACATGTPTPARTTLPHELWFSISDGEQRFGYLHVAARPSGGGAAEYAVESRTQIEFLGTAQELVTTATLVADADLVPLRVEAEVQAQSGSRRIVGRADAAAFVVEIDSGAETRTETIPLAGPALVFDVMLGEWLHRHAADAGAAKMLEVRLLDAQGNALLVALRRIEATNETSTWEALTEDAAAPAVLRFDREGALVEQRSRFPTARVERCPRETAVVIAQRAMPARELLMFPLGRELPPLRLLQRLVVRLEWDAIPPEEFELEDSRQRLQSLVADGSRHKALVALLPAAAKPTDATLPLAVQGFEAQLGDGDFIRPSHPRIAATARKVVGPETSALAAATALCGWVYGHVGSEMIAETLSGPEVLERGVGKCTEYATLFASLARAAGIPTRVVLGERLAGDAWGGHMWNEVWVGTWIPVDASANEVGGSPALLKLVHSDTVAGTQPLRWKLTESLGITVVDVESARAAAGRTGLDGRVYTNVEHGFRIALPSTEWRVETRGERGVLTLRLRPPDTALGDGAMLHLVAFDIPATTPPKAIVDARLKSHRASLPDLEVLADEEVRVVGAPGRRLEFRGVPPGEGAVPTRVTEVLWIRGGAGFLFNLIGTDATHAEYSKAFADVLASFEILED